MDRFTDEELRLSMDEVFDSFHQVVRTYKRGLSIREEFIKELERIIRDCYYDLIEKRGLHEHFTTHSWSRFIEDCSLWSNKKDPVSSKGEPWLTDSNHQEASIHDKSLFFYLMKCFHTTPDYYLPVPDDIIHPDRDVTHSFFGGCSMVIKYSKVNSKTQRNFF